MKRLRRWWDVWKFDRAMRRGEPVELVGTPRVRVEDGWIMPTDDPQTWPAGSSSSGNFIWRQP